MCWIIDRELFKNNPENYHKVAEKDIIVYKFGKVREGNFIPFYRNNYTYISKCNNIRVELKLHYNVSINLIYFGYHSYLEKDYVINKIIDLQKTKFLYSIYPFIVGKFIIPKGTEYYINADKEIVSSSIIWTGEGLSSKENFKPIK